MFRLNRNERSHWSGNGVHVESELVFMIGRNMHLSSALPHLYSAISTRPSERSRSAAANQPECSWRLIPGNNGHWLLLSQADC